MGIKTFDKTILDLLEWIVLYNLLKSNRLWLEKLSRREGEVGSEKVVTAEEHRWKRIVSVRILYRMEKNRRPKRHREESFAKLANL